MSRGDLDQLRELLVGNVVARVEAPDPDVREGGICKIITRAQHGDMRKGIQFTLQATDMGWWIDRVQSVQWGPDGGWVVTWESIPQVVENMIEHILSEAMDGWEGLYERSPFTAHDDPWTRRMGFRCEHTGKEWWFSLKALKAFSAETGIHLNDPDHREQFATFVGINHQIPKPGEMGGEGP
jgi:hypothetical protein